MDSKIILLVIALIHQGSARLIPNDGGVESAVTSLTEGFTNAGSAGRFSIQDIMNHNILAQAQEAGLSLTGGLYHLWVTCPLHQILNLALQVTAEATQAALQLTGGVGNMLQIQETIRKALAVAVDAQQAALELAGLGELGEEFQVDKIINQLIAAAAQVEQAAMNLAAVVGVEIPAGFRIDNKLAALTGNAVDVESNAGFAGALSSSSSIFNQIAQPVTSSLNGLTTAGTSGPGFFQNVLPFRGATSASAPTV